MAAKVGLNGRRAKCYIEGNDSIGSDQTFTLPAQGGELLTSSAFAASTWTPTISTTNNNLTASYSQQHGTYLEVGRLVFITARIVLSSVSGGTGSVTLGLPFTAATSGVSGNNQYGINITYADNFDVAPRYGIVEGAQNKKVVLYGASDDNVTNAISAGNLNANSTIAWGGVYLKA